MSASSFRDIGRPSRGSSSKVSSPRRNVGNKLREVRSPTTPLPKSVHSFQNAYDALVPSFNTYNNEARTIILFISHVDGSKIRNKIISNALNNN